MFYVKLAGSMDNCKENEVVLLLTQNPHDSSLHSVRISGAVRITLCLGLRDVTWWHARGSDLAQVLFIRTTKGRLHPLLNEKKKMSVTGVGK